MSKNGYPSGPSSASERSEPAMTANPKQLNDALNKIERIQVADIRPDDIVILHVGELESSEVERLKEAWTAATELPNKVLVVSGDLEIEIKKPLAS